MKVELVIPKIEIHVHSSDGSKPEALAHLEKQVNLVILMTRRVIQAVVKDPHELEVLTAQLDEQAARLGEAMKATGTP